MESFEEEKKKIKKRRQNYFDSKNTQIDVKEDENRKRYVNNLIARLLIGVIVFFGVIILTNFNKDVNAFVEEHVLKDNISFSKISNFYNKYFGDIVPLQNMGNDTQTVFNEKITYNSIKNYQDGYELGVEKNYLIPVINSGIVVFIGEKEGLGNTVIIQGIDEIDYWYSNITNLSVSLYDYVSRGALLGTSDGEKMYLTFKKSNEFLEYDEVVHES